MPRTVGFADAARLLGGAESRLLTWLDKLLTAGLTAAAPATGGVTLSLFEPKNQLVTELAQLRRRSVDRLNGVNGRTRGEVMTAAHTVLLVSAYFDTLAETPWLAGREAGWRSADQTRLLLGQVPAVAQEKIVAELLGTPPPVPTPGVPREDFAVAAVEFFAAPSRDLVRFLSGNAVWDQMSENDQAALELFVNRELPRAALRRYDGYVIQLAGQSPEFLCWTLLNEFQATRHDLHGRLREVVIALAEAKTGLAGLTAALPGLGSPAGSPRRWTELANRYAQDLDLPILSPGDHGAPVGMTIPTLGEAYVNHAFRAISYDPERHRPHDDGWWESIPVREEIQGFIAACLADPAATTQPLLLLGHPGSGKSVLSRVLAARLGAAGHPAVRVDLRRVPADAPIHRQVSEALALALNRTVDWADLADSAGSSALPVLLLDGLDELIQSSQASRSDYLEQVADFQRTEAARGRPVVAVVTSRTMVAHRTRIPPGTTVVRLEPFNLERIGRWLATWNTRNADFFRQAALQPLARETVLRHPDLARQPLLLLMLALYDADGNALQREREPLANADLYERLLRSFARREVRKHHPDATDDETAELVERELEQLSIAAVAMFNRDSQVVSEPDLEDDLRALRGRTGPRGTGGGRRRLTEAQLLIGRFFFVHASHSTYRIEGEQPLRAYEFLHATFGEYLVARLATRTVTETYADTGRPRRGLAMAATRTDDSLLTALLSFQVLTMRAPVVEFLRHLLGAVGRSDDGQRLADQLVEALANSGYAYDPGGFAGYQPRDLELITRLAIRSANLVILLLALRGGEVDYRTLFPDAEDPADRWRRLSSFWQATLDTKAWLSLVGAMEAYPVGTPAQVRLREHPQSIGPPRNGFDLIYWSNALIGDPVANGITRAVLPFGRMDEGVLTALPTSTPIPPAAALVRLATIGPGRRVISSHRWTSWYRSSYESLLSGCLLAAEKLPPDRRAPYLTLVFRQLGMVPAAVPISVVELAHDLLAGCDAGSSRNEAAREFICALAELRHRDPAAGPALARIAGQVPYPSHDLQFLEALRREWIDYVSALAELGVPLDADSPLRLERVLHPPGAAWRAVRGDLVMLGRLLRGARGADRNQAAVAVLRLLEMLPGSKLGRLPWRDLLVTVARAHRVEPELAGKVVRAWDAARQRSFG